MGRSMEDDLRLGQIAVRMGLLRAQDLPDLIQEARAGHVEESAGSGSAFAQLLLRKRLLSVSDYLYMAGQARTEATHHDSDPMIQVGAAFKSYESGELDIGSFEEIVARSGEPIRRPEGRTEKFGNYELLSEIARGGMGIVYRARDLRTSRMVALKVMIECDDDEVRLQRFEREAELCASLDHPNVVRIHDAGRIEGMPYFTMDYVEGDSLDDLLEGSGVARDLAIKVIAQSARAMDHAHERGIIHRDLKPGNILIERITNTGRVTDFGLARDLHRGTRLTQVGQAVGTPYYMAPEQVRGERDVDGRCDVYALGVILYEILTGDVPFDADSPLSLFRKIDREEIVLEIDEAKGIDSRIQRVTLRALAKDREQRYHRASYFADDLERYLRGEEPRARPFEWRERLRGLFRGGGRGAALGTLALVTLIVIGVAGALSVRRLRASRTRDQVRSEVQAALDTARAKLAGLESPGDNALKEAEEGLAALEETTKLRSGEGVGPEEAREAFEEGQGAQLVLGLSRARAAAMLQRVRSAKDLEAARQGVAAVLALDPQERPLRLALAECEAAHGGAKEALTLLAKVISIDAGDPAARLARGRLLVSLGQAEEGLRDLSALLLQRPEDVKARAMRARAYLVMGQLRAARFDAEKARALAPKEPWGYLAVGAVARAEGKSAEAAASYEEARKLSPKSPRPLLELGGLRAYAGSYELAREQFQQGAALGAVAEGRRGAALAEASLYRLAEAEASLRDGIRETEGLPSGEQARARALLRVAAAEVALAADGQEAARTWLEEAAAEAPRSEAVMVWRARWFLLRGDAKGAQEVLSKARRSAGPELLTVRSALALAQGHGGEARAFAEQALARSPAGGGHSRARRALAAALLGQNQEPAARRACLAAWNASAEDDDLAGHLLREGLELAELRAAFGAGGTPDRAEEYLHAVTRIDPSRAPAWGALARLAFNDRNVVPARRYLRKALALDPFRPALRVLEAELALGAERPVGRDLEEALSGIEKVLEAQPSAELLLLRARVQLRLARYPDASGTLNRLGQLLHTRPEVETLRARALKGQGDDAGARLATEKAAELGPQRRRARERGLQEARSLRGQDEAQARALLDAAIRTGSHRYDEDLGPLVMFRVELARDRIDALQTLAPLFLHQPRWQSLDLADRTLAARWAKPLSSDGWDTLRRSAKEGSEGAEVAMAVAALYDVLTGEASSVAIQDGLAAAERVLAETPTCLAAQLARAALRVHTGDPLRALRKLRRLETSCSDSGLYHLVVAEAAAAARREDFSRAALERAASRKLPDLDARRDRSRFLGAKRR
jgi:predicted Zn-dependent protease